MLSLCPGRTAASVPGDQQPHLSQRAAPAVPAVDHCHCIAPGLPYIVPCLPAYTCTAIGIPLTMRQLAAEGLPSVVARLVGRRHYLLAMRICQALGLSTEEVGGRTCAVCNLPVALSAASPAGHADLPSPGQVRVVTCQRLVAASSFVSGARPRAGAVARQHRLGSEAGKRRPPHPQVVVRWACDKISAAAASLPDEQLMEALQVGCTAGRAGSALYSRPGWFCPR